MKIDKTRHRGRKPIDPDLRREVCLSFRVNKYEHEQLKHLADLECIELGHYIREKTLKTKPPKRKIIIPEYNQEYLKTFSYISNNLNQITKKLNSDNDNDEILKKEVKLLVDILLSMSKEMKEIKE